MAERSHMAHASISMKNMFEVLNLIDGEDALLDVGSKSKAMGSNRQQRQASASSVEIGGNNKESDDKHDLKKPLVWIDLEMTGLELQKHRILEIACIITDGKLEKMIEDPNLIIHQSDDVLEQMNDWSLEHHAASGLTESVRNSTLTEQEAGQQVKDFVSRHVERGRGTLVGNSVYVDLQFIQKYMPDLASFFSHVLVNVSSVCALCIRWYRREANQAPKKKKTHRALEDIKESIAELKYMQGAIFRRLTR